MSKWKPIKSAPRTGERILLYCDFEESGREILIGGFKEDGHVGPKGKFCWKVPNDGGAVAADCVTHWMPLPKAPEIT